MPTHPGIAWRAVAAAVLCAGLLRPASAQEAGDSASRARARADSIARVRAIADSILLEDDPEDELGLPALPPSRQSVTLQSMNRGYTIGGTSIAENVGFLTYQWKSDDWKVMLAGSPLRYAGNGTTISGVPPVTARVDWRFAKGDTLRVYGRTSSSPATLDSLQTAAIGAVSVSTIDLESLALGTPAMIGTRATFSFDLGSDVTLGLHGGLEFQPRPSGGQRVYWTGTTILGGATLTGLASDMRWSTGLDVSRSSADSLLMPGDSVGRNLFPGGGTFSANAQLDGPLTTNGDATIVAGLWYQRPFGNDRPDQPNRLIPVGDTYGAFVTLDLPVRDWIIEPSLSIARESASDDATISRQLRYQYQASSWAGTAGVAVAIPLGRQFELSPEAGATFGNAEAIFTAIASGSGSGSGRRPGRTAISAVRSGIRGWYAGVELRITY
ncbi:MAG: hypothetical protein HY275_12415 [Gemmatimonadetes bacterium]|nr:hypothetical protein [Gemmatimonadota bacterium]